MHHAIAQGFKAVLECVCNSAQIIITGVLIVGKHLHTGVSDQLQLARSLHVLHQGGGCVAATVRREFTPSAVLLYRRVGKSHCLQCRIKSLFAVFVEGVGASVRCAEHGPAYTVADDGVNKGVDFGRYGNRPVGSGLCFSASDKALFPAVVIFDLQAWKFAGTKTKIAIAVNVIGCKNLSNIPLRRAKHIVDLNRCSRIQIFSLLKISGRKKRRVSIR